MKRAVLTLLVMTFLFAADFDWFTNYQEALKVAQKRNKPIMLMISQKNCNMCEYMDEVTFENDDVVDFIEVSFIPLKLGIKDAQKLGLKAYGTPTFYFLDKSGKRLTRALVGAATPKVFLEKIKEIKEQYAH